MMTPDYSYYVWPAFLFTVIVLGAITIRSLRQLRNVQQQLSLLTQDGVSDGDEH